MPGPVAVIDIGSNSIKVLVAARAADGSVTALHVQTIDARISAGITKTPPELSPEGMQRGVDAVRELLAATKPFAPERTIVVATSAVRDAHNGGEFRERVRAETGQEIRVLGGEEEANLIGRGLTCDPALRHLRDFYVFDLGGGSLECLTFRDRKIEQAVSLPLGCVRLMERYVPDPTRHLGRTPKYRIMQHVHDTLVYGPFKFVLGKDAAAVGTGGTMTTVRAIFGAREGKSFEETEPLIPLTQLRLLLSTVAHKPLVEREKIPGLPVARADVFPTALATMVVVADVGAVSAFHHSVYNLRYGVADEALNGA